MLHITIMIIVSLCTINVLGGPEKGRVVMPTKWSIIYLEEVYFVTALVPSETACLASSPGRSSLSCLDFPGGDGGPLVVVGQTGSLSSDPLKDVVDEGVHDAHGLGGDTSVGVDLLQHLVDVDSIGLLPLVLLLL